MGMRKIAFWVGLFSMVMGWWTYDPEVVTAPVPIITGGVVVVLALLDWIPEFRRCCGCGKKSPLKKKSCVHCGLEFPDR